MKNLGLIMVLTLMMSSLFVGCGLLKDKAIPAIKKSASEKLVSAIVDGGECANSAQVKADVDKFLKIESDEGVIAKALGSEAPEGSQQEGIVSEICKAAAKLALPALLQKGVPAKWECSLSDLNSKISELASAACGKISG